MTQISYQLNSILAEGAIYTLYRGLAYLPDGQTRDVAIKKLKPHIVQDPVILSHLAGFSDVARGLQHPNLAPLWDLGQHNGEYFFVREFLPGCSLQQLLQQVSQNEAILSPAMAVFITQEITEAIAALHRYRVPGDQPIYLFHGGLSPENVILTRIGGIVLTDAGLDVIFWRNPELAHWLQQQKGPYQPPEYSTGQRPMRRGDAFGVTALLYHMIMSEPLPLRDTGWYDQLKNQVPSSKHPRITEQFDQLLLDYLHPAVDQRQVQIDQLRQELAKPGLLRQSKAQRREAMAYIEALVGQVLAHPKPEQAVDIEPPFQLESLLPVRPELAPPHRRYRPPQFDNTASFQPIQTDIALKGVNAIPVDPGYVHEEEGGDDLEVTTLGSLPPAEPLAPEFLVDDMNEATSLGSEPPEPFSAPKTFVGEEPSPAPLSISPAQDQDRTLMAPVPQAPDSSPPEIPPTAEEPGFETLAGSSSPEVEQPLGFGAPAAIPPPGFTKTGPPVAGANGLPLLTTPATTASPAPQQPAPHEEILAISEGMELEEEDGLDSTMVSSTPDEPEVQPQPPAPIDLASVVPSALPSPSTISQASPPRITPVDEGTSPGHTPHNLEETADDASEVLGPDDLLEVIGSDDAVEIPDVHLPQAPPVQHFPQTPSTMALPLDQVEGYLPQPPTTPPVSTAFDNLGLPMDGTSTQTQASDSDHPIVETVALPIEQITGSQKPPENAQPLPPADGMERFGKFVLLNRIAFGGMAEVFRAKMEGAVGFQRIVAIKRILPEYSEDPTFIQMFTDEARIAGSLTHPHIVQINELGEVDGIYYISMEMIDGIDLARVIKIRRTLAMPIPLGVILDVVIPVCKALHYAHTAVDPNNNPLQMIHRDVTPHNILISKKGEIKLTDFGIAKAAQNIAQTAVGELKGKLSYMSPEQAEGRPVDQRTDIFQVGIVLYEMLTLRKMFEGNSDHSVLHKIQNAMYPPPRQLVANIPELMEQIVLRALAVDSRQRYQTASELERDLTHLRNSLPIQERNRDVSAFTQEIIAQRDQILADIAANRRDPRIGMAPPMPQPPALQPPPQQGGLPMAPMLDSAGPNIDLGEPQKTEQELGGKNKSTSTSKWSTIIIVIMLILGGVVGYLVLSGPPPKPPTAPLRIQTRPAGAVVLLDGQKVGQTPLKTTIPFDTRPHVLQLLKKGYKPFTHNFRLNQLGDEVDLFLNLPRSKRR